MRKVLLFMILMNSITFVTNNLAMVEEEENNKEMSQLVQDAEKNTEEAEEEKRFPKFPESEDEQYTWKRLIKKGAVLFLMLSPFGGLVSTIVINGNKTHEMHQLVSPITYYPDNNFSRNPNCTYENYANFNEAPSFAARGECKNTDGNYYVCTIEKCKNWKQWEKVTSSLSWTKLGLFFSAYCSAPALFLGARWLNKKQHKS